jgi:hypothetical protein
MYVWVANNLLGPSTPLFFSSDPFFGPAAVYSTFNPNLKQDMPRYNKKKSPPVLDPCKSQMNIKPSPSQVELLFSLRYSGLGTGRTGNN